LARGRALALRLPGISMASYIEALERQVRDFPADPATEEARWLLGEVRLAEKDRKRAEAVWSTIAPSSPRWLDARLALANLAIDRMDGQQDHADRRRMLEEFERADKPLAESIRKASSEPAIAELSLARARLNLTPGVGNAAVAAELCDRVARLPLSAALH